MSLHIHKLVLPRLQRERTIRILLPPTYDLTDDYHYPVLYALDGQNLFDPELAVGGQCWEIPETVAQMPPQLQAIIVGIDNGEEARLDEYAPLRKEEGGGEADDFLEDLITYIKPFVDAEYRTRPDPEATGIVGSSMGGLLALYAGLQYGHVFGRVGVLSPAVWFNPEVLDLAKQHEGYKSRFYVAGSQTESEEMAEHVQQIAGYLQQSGFTGDRLLVNLRECGDHGEDLWRREYPEMHAWLFHN